MVGRDAGLIKNNIVKFLEEKGPSLPIFIAREIREDMIFCSAFLSELIADKKIKSSNMKIGSSSLFYIPGQESGLENFSNYLKSKEKEAFARLKENGVLRDSEQEPAIRVALRAIKDFAIPFEKNEEIYWRYFLFSLEDVEKKEEVIHEKVEEIIESNEKEEIGGEDFIERVRIILRKEGIKVIEELEVKKKEYFGIGRVEFFGETEIIIWSKDKKKLNQKDLELVKEKLIEHKKPAIIVSLGELDKKAKDFYRDHKNLMKILSK